MFLVTNGVINEIEETIYWSDSTVEFIELFQLHWRIDTVD